MSSRKSERATSMLSLYDGQRCVGFVLARGRVGFDAAEHSLEVFETQNGAINKIQATSN
jgi:hypothetical protein